MKLAINYSPAAGALAASGQIDLDYFKTPAWPDMIARAEAVRPVAIHFELQAGSGKLRQTDWEPVQDWLERTDTPYVNVHLSPVWEDFPGVSPQSDEAKLSRLVLERLVEDVGALVDRFGPERVIAENIPPVQEYRNVVAPAAFPDLICQVIHQTGCGLLLDISHARMAAHSLGLDPWDYLDSLPVERLREMHFTGLGWVNDVLYDHLPIRDEDWPYLEDAQERIRAGKWARPWLLAFEYGGEGGFFAQHTDPAVLAAQTPRLLEIVRGI